MKSILKQIFSSDQALSSKRIFGGIGFICSIIMIWTKVANENVPYLLYVSVSLIGLESVTQIFKKENNNQQGGVQ